jgi:hypothetical protein
MEDKKKVSYSFEGTKLIVKVDLNGDGEPVISLAIDIKEIPEEVLAAISSAKA